MISSNLEFGIVEWIDENSGIFSVKLESGETGRFRLVQCCRVVRGTTKPYLDNRSRLSPTLLAEGVKVVFARDIRQVGNFVQASMWGFKKFYDQHLATPASVVQKPVEVKRTPVRMYVPITTPLDRELEELHYDRQRGLIPAFR